RVRLVVAAAQPVRPAPGQQREPGRRADRRIRVAVREAQSFRCHAVELGRAPASSAIAAEIGVAEIVGEDEDEVGLHYWSALKPDAFTTGAQRARSSAIRRASSSALLPTGSQPIFCRRSATSGARTAFARAAERRSTEAFGVLAGA